MPLPAMLVEQYSLHFKFLLRLKRASYRFPSNLKPFCVHLHQFNGGNQLVKIMLGDIFFVTKSLEQITFSKSYYRNSKMYWAVSSHDKLSSDFTSHGLLVCILLTFSKQQPTQIIQEQIIPKQFSSSQDNETGLIDKKEAVY